MYVIVCELCACTFICMLCVLCLSMSSQTGQLLVITSLSWSMPKYWMRPWQLGKTPWMVWPWPAKCGIERFMVCFSWLTSLCCAYLYFPFSFFNCFVFLSFSFLSFFFLFSIFHLSLCIYLRLSKSTYFPPPLFLSFSFFFMCLFFLFSLGFESKPFELLSIGVHVKYGLAPNNFDCYCAYVFVCLLAILVFPTIFVLCACVCVFLWLVGCFL